MNPSSIEPLPDGVPAPRRFAAVTTCHADGFALYGRRMVETYLRHWPPSVRLHLYTEGFAPPAQMAERVVSRDLGEAAPALVAFKERHRAHALANGQSRGLRWNPGFGRVRARRGGLDLRPLRRLLGYRWDAVRFSHKVFAILDAARRTDADVLVWIDADTRFFADVAPGVLEGVAPRDRFVGYLRREGTHSETGFVAYNLRHPATRPLLAELEALYTRDGFLAEHEFHDSYLFDVVRERAEGRGHRSHDIALGIGRSVGHVLVNSELGRFMDHLKGDRKEAGASHAADLVANRAEPYWAGVR